MKRMNCPNCGAPINGFECEYCGTRFYDMADMEIGETSYLRFKYQNRIYAAEVVLEDIELAMRADELTGIKIRMYAISDITVKEV